VNTKKLEDIPENIRCFYRTDQYGAYCKFETKYVFNYMDFVSLFETGNYKNLEELRVYLKGFVGNYFDNNPFYFSNIYGDTFSFLVFDTISIFAENGQYNLGTYDLSSSGAAVALAVADKYTKGYCNCSMCGEEIKIVDIAGSYFGGRYCSRCWLEGYQGKESMKSVEARENHN
jgi:hypothetical protein